MSTCCIGVAPGGSGGPCLPPPPKFLALKVGVVIYLIITSKLARRAWSIDRPIIVLSRSCSFWTKDTRLLNLRFCAYGWLYIVLMDLALVHCIRAFEGCGRERGLIFRARCPCAFFMSLPTLLPQCVGGPLMWRGG